MRGEHAAVRGPQSLHRRSAFDRFEDDGTLAAAERAATPDRRKRPDGWGRLGFVWIEERAAVRAHAACGTRARRGGGVATPSAAWLRVAQIANVDVRRALERVPRQREHCIGVPRTPTGRVGARANVSTLSLDLRVRSSSIFGVRGGIGADPQLSSTRR